MKPVPIESALSDLVRRVSLVRRWFLTLQCLRATSVALGCLAVSVTVCWGLTWIFEWQIAGRCLCGAVLLCFIAGAVLWVSHVCSDSVTFSEAAVKIEAHQTVHRQLVTAMEYYENQARFPYSRGLTHVMIRRVFRRSHAQDFGDCVPRRQVWVYGVVIGLEILILGGFLVSESAFWYRQWTQSAHAAGPGEGVDSASRDAAALTSVTGDILTEPNTLVTFEARSGLEAEDQVRFVLQRKDPNGGPGDTVFSSDVSGAPNPDSETQQFSVQQFCESPDQYQYRFESESETTPWSDLAVSPRPQITSVMSQVHNPNQGAHDPNWQPVEFGSVDVVAGSDVTLKIQTDQPLSQVQVSQNGQIIDTLTPDGPQVEYQCQPEESQSLTFTPVNELGQAVETPFYVELEVKKDQKPHIELLVPEGDLPLIAPVPVPVTFRISDDVGLASVALCYEVKNRPAKRVEMPVTDLAKEAELSRTLALDRWHLVEGDTVMFYCEATDVPLDPCGVAQEAVSEIYFIEIQRDIKIEEPQKANPGFAETLMDALEYTRAIMKKTWTLSHVQDMTPLHLESEQALMEDLAHTQKVIERNRDDEDMNFSDQDKAELNQVIDALSEAEQSLGLSQSSEAVEAEKRGYRILRDFIKESDRTPQQAPPTPKPKVPEKIKVQTEPETPPPMSEQEAKAELQDIQKQLESLTQQQKQLKKALDKALSPQDDPTAAQAKRAPESGETVSQASQGQSGQESSAPADAPAGGSQSQSPSQASSPSAGQGQSPGQGDSSDQGSGDTESQGQSSSGQGSPSSGTGQGQSGQGQGQGDSHQGQSGQGQGQGSSGQGQSGQGQGQGSSGQGQSGQGQGQPQSQPGQGSGQGSGQGTSQSGTSQSSGVSMTPSQAQASQAARLAMLEARQKALQSMADQIEEALDRVAQAASGPERQSGQQAADHVQQASDAMDQMASQLDRLHQGADQAEESVHTMSREALNQILDQLSLADTAMDESLLDSPLDRQIKEAQKMTDQLMADVEAMTQAPQQVDAEAMKKRLENAERLLDELVQAQSTVVRKTQRGQGLPTSLTLTDYQATSPSQAARQMVQRLWTAVMALSQAEGRALERPGSVSQFWELENAFFERASQYQAEGDK